MITQAVGSPGAGVPIRVVRVESDSTVGFKSARALNTGAGDSSPRGGLRALTVQGLKGGRDVVRASIHDGLFRRFKCCRARQHPCRI